MAATNGPQAPAEEIRRLFAELREAYARVEEAVPPALHASDANAAARFMEQTHRVSDLIRRIREIQGL